MMSLSTLWWGRTEAKPQFLVLKHGHKRVMVKRQSYNLMLDTACKHFPSIPRDMIMLQTNQLDVCDGHYVDITPEIWDDLIDSLHVVEVTRHAEMTLPIPLLPLDAWAFSFPGHQSAPSQANGQDAKNKKGKNKNKKMNEQDSSDDDIVTIKVVFPSGEIQTAKVSKELRVDKLVADASHILGRCPTDIMAVWGGAILRGDLSIGSYNIKDGDSINLQLQASLRIAKPVIYLYSPSDIDVSVKLSLIPEWSLSVIYPVVTTEDHGQRLEWNVRTHQDGSLMEHNSGLDVSYLFWEAESNLQTFARSPASKPQPVDTFNPISSSLDDMDSIVIPVDNATVYLDKSLKALGLHTEARTSFITYWLPSILKHEYIALRFVPQAAYERAASLSISPQPDVVTRVCMLFKGICKEHLANWADAQMQAEKDVAWWVDVVGVDPARAGDTSLFRVLEWGGLEVLV
ncbi:hypothetical protein DFJ58DRAFT_31194 [Suillus subalutaceus]|uniref:uncharacterized protein n=1 Tax=Suillus subalutaceus TaxID=48586 RepID=UPI001B87239C|nr:uncharacterized protein DFJ58DRAFT_31194 [Suillus subalutaceus]KAG1844203.1 hypothetical protein DFJ58DRAFT_31194 [Suillus subalutaceus]